MKLTLKQLHCYPEYRKLATIIEPEEVKEVPSTSVGDELTRTIFAPDPLSGVPRSDLAVIMSKDSSPVVSDYIQKTLMRQVPTQPFVGDKSEDADFVLSSMKSRLESFNDYANRLRALCSPQGPDSNSDTKPF